MNTKDTATSNNEIDNTNINNDGASQPIATGPKNDRGAAALAKFRPRFQVIAPKDCLQITLDVQTVCTSLVGAAPHVCVHREELATLPNFDLESTCDLEEVGYALFEADQRAFGADDNHRLDLALQKAVPLKNKFYATYDMLLAFGFVSKKWVDSLHDGSGFRDLAGDLIMCKNKFYELPPEVRAKTLITDDDCQEAVTQADDIIQIVGYREANWTGDGPNPALERVQMYTLAMHIYDEARRGIQYVRFYQKDADDIAPSLYNRGSRRSSGAESKSAQPATTDSAPVTKPADKVAPVIVDTDTKASPIPPAKNGGPFTS